jgi:hypothetical protein
MKDNGDVRSSSTVGRKGSSYQRQRTVQNAMEHTTIATHPKRFALIAEELQSGIIVNLVINGSRSMIS